MTNEVTELLVKWGEGDESAPVGLDDMKGPYKRSKFLAEQVALEFAAGGFPVVIVNPTAPIGDHDFKPTPTGKIVLDFLKDGMPAYIDTVVEHLDAVCLSGAINDVDPLRYGCEPSIPAVRARVRDIAGIRITSSFESDVYWIASMLTKQPDVTLVQTKDYIANPKPNGYRSLHLIVQVPVFLSDHTELVYVEIQIRTIAMDFWASVEHKLFYK